MPAPAQLAPRNSQLASEKALASHRAAQERHFIRRAKQRFGLRVSSARYPEFCRRIMDVDERFSVKLLARDKENPARMNCAARFGGYAMRVIFDERTERLVTCMPFKEECIFDFARDRRAKRIRLKMKPRRHDVRRAEPSL